ncbi:MAG: proprotein convertase P-domain-containing protein [Planctomycetaceae bacterium]
MTVLQSLLSTFRRSRSQTRRVRRNQAPSSVASEALEQRLLLTNPDAFESLPGAPVTIYLDFDGHTESSTWTNQRLSGTGPIDTPAYDFDGAPTFNQAERDSIQEIWARVAEDFRPLNINVTTVEPGAFRVNREVFVSIGGDGAWSVAAGDTAARYAANTNGFSTPVTAASQTVFVFQTRHAGLGGGLGGFEQNIASSVSQAVAISMGLQVHQSGGLPLEGDTLVAPILGDNIVGADNVPGNPLSVRDIWYDAPGAGAANQDDLQVLTSNSQIAYRQDDHGNTTASATGISITPNIETVTGVIERQNDVDLFSFTAAATQATISVAGLDLTGAPFFANTPGSNLDPVIRLLAPNGTELGRNDGAGLQSSLTVNIPDGTFYIEISNRSEYGNLGEYTLTLTGVDSTPAFVNPISLESKPNAPVTFYLAFAQDTIADTNPILASRTDGATGDKPVAAYDSDGDPSTFSVDEIDEMTEIWARVAEDFRPFDVNVTTIRPGNLQDGVSAQVTIGDNIGSFANFAPVNQIGYIALTDAFTDPTLPNTGYVFSENLGAGALRGSERIAARASSAFAVMLGLDRHPVYSSNGTLIAPLDPGNNETSPILGETLGLRDIWVSGATTAGAGVLQDDLAALNNSLAYRTDDYPDTLANATRINIMPGDDVLTGIIEMNDDVDVFRFDALASTATINVTGIDVSGLSAGAGAGASFNTGSNLDPVLELLNAGGAVIASSDIPFTPFTKASLTASLTQDIPAGTYYIRVSNRGEYGNLGQYTLTLQGVDGNPVTVSFSQSVFNETDGFQSGVGTVRRPAGQLFGPPIVVDLVSTDPTQVTVPAQVTIPAGAPFANFDITILDDDLLDGDQRVGIQASVDGIANSEAFLTITDHETVTVSLTPNPVGEDAGTAQLTVSRSNTDVFAPSHWVVVGNELREYPAVGDGTPTRTIPIEWPGTGGVFPFGQNAHDVTVMRDGRVAIFNGTTNAYLSLFNPKTDVWDHIGPISGLSGDLNDATAGGIASSGNYVFLSDLKSADGDPHGLVRVDVTTGDVVRFGDRIVGARIFAMANKPVVFGNGAGRGRTVYEIDPQNGALLNTLTLEKDADAITFDGTHLWVVVRISATNQVDELLKIDPDTGDILEVHPLGALQNSAFEGLTYLNGIFYIVDNEGNATGNLTVESYNPNSRLVAGPILAVEQVNGGIEVGSFFGSLPSGNRLLAADVNLSVIYEIDPTSGVIVRSFNASQPYPPDTFDFIDPFTLFPENFGTGPGVSSVSDVVIGGVTYPELIYVHSAPNEFDLYTRSGTIVDADPTRPGINPLVTEVAFSGDFSGEDVPGISASEPKFRDVTVGFDDRVYALTEDGLEIAVHNQNTFARVGTILLDRAVRTISVADSTGIYAGDQLGNVVLFDLNGTTISLAATGLGVITDIEVNLGQEVLIADAGGTVLLTDQSAVAAGDLSGATTLENSGGLSFVSFGRHTTRSTGDIVVSLQSDDLTELRVPATIMIPEGQQSVVIDVTIVDDNERDGDQTVHITAASQEYVSTSTTVVVTDVENVGVEVLPDDVTEGDGTLPDQVRVFRTDVDGPLDFAATLTAAVTTPQPIIDNDVSISEIIVPSQVSRVTDVNVTLTIQHSAIPDLDVFLISPGGTRIALFNDLSSNGSNLTNTVFDDQAAVRIVNGSAPYTGRFIPKQALANFIGENPSGSWKLEVVDDSVSDAGVLMNWSLQIATIGLSEATVTLFSDDTTEATVLGTVKIPANQSEILVDLDVLDDSIVDGTQTVTISATEVTINNQVQGTFILTSDVVDVQDAEPLTIQVDRTAVSEAAGPGAIAGVITRLDSVGDAVIILTSSDTSELTVPVSVTILDGQTSVPFVIDAVDDADFDGDQQVTISAGGSGYLTVTSEVITVEDQEPRLQLSTLTPIVAEDAGTMTFTLARLDATDLSAPLTVNLSSSDTSELLVPATVSIPIGEVSTTFVATVLGDTELDGSQDVTITASDANTTGQGISSATLNVTIQDAEFLSISVPAGSESVLENAGVGAVTATVSVSSIGHTSPIIVTLSNSDLTELSIPTQVVIPVGESSATFLIDVLNDPQIDRNQSVVVTAQVLGYRDGVLNMTVLDHEPPTLIGPTVDVTDPTPALLWGAVDGATRYDLWVNDVSRNINQLFRLENLPARLPLFSDNFEAGTFDETRWTSTGAEVDMLALNDNGMWSAHLNGNPDGGDTLESATIDLSAEPGAQLTYSWQRTGSGDAPTAGQDLILSYRDAEGVWVELQRQLGVGSSMTVFNTSVVTLPAAALHDEFAFRFQSIGDPNVEDAGATVDDWFIDDVSISGFEKFEPTQELGVGRYRYWVRAYDNLEQPGFWSAPRNFNIRTAPEFTSPVPNAFLAETRFPQFTWTSVVDTARYDLWIDNLTTGESQVVRETDLPTTSFASATANLPGGTYKAWVRAIGPDGTAGRWSFSTVFTVLSTPTNIRPSGSTFDRTPEIRWDAVEGATHYDIWVSKLNYPEPAVIALRDQFVTGTTRIPSTDLADGRYAVWVRAIADDGTKSPWSDPVEFIIGGRPTVTAPVNGSSTSTSPVIVWTGINQADHYEIWINNSDGDRVIHNQDIRATSFSIAGPLPADTYRVWVRAVSVMGERSFWSVPVNFTVVANNAPRTFDSQPGDSGTALLTSMPAETAGVSKIEVMAGDEFFAPAMAMIVDDPVRVPGATVTASNAQTGNDVDEVNDDAQSVDRVMAEWSLVDWLMTDSEDETATDDSSLAAAALGLLAAGTSVRTRRRKGESPRS